MKSAYGLLQQIDIDTCINEVVQTFLKSDNAPCANKVLAIQLQLRASYYSPSRDGIDQQYLKEFWLLYYSPSNCTTVCYSDSDTFNIWLGSTEVKFETCHNSCWRDATHRVINLYATEIEHKCNSFDLLKNKKHQWTIYNSFGILGMQICDATIDSRNGYETGVAKYIKNTKI